MDLATLNRGQMKRTTPELAPLLQSSAPHPQEDIGPLRMLCRATGPILGGSSVDSGLESGTLCLRNRDLTTGPPWPYITFFMHTMVEQL
ncbi:hypothetical protein AVEN_180989-1 [Araneus ventricosus]|uniref:Uncharacterized protein n=1 Tax=Araneus ventricosus TaxID=182803 RepID=A0A4Y1ZNF3_ARAVE|nr:hypothetical protein AVEN_52376-1 [Araneus ventricosus]GBL59392.1 hypothetical protein AVEN_113093-1 [Araneus ventricosus]GBL59420.1 hypothetical protein AVEN_159991-1 [Araneus ventricosus]GBL59446.1 hypothetical protein AVEN_180989-1 [Araneus ventricosus]